MVRNWVKRSTSRSRLGEALLRLRISQPACGNAALACAVTARAAASTRVVLRQAQPIGPAHEAAGLQQAGGAQRGLAHEEARPEADAAGELVRLAGQRRAHLEPGVADGDACAWLDVEPCHQRRIGGCAEYAVVFDERGGQWPCRIELRRAIERIGAIDRFHLDKCCLAVVAARHGAQRCRRRHRAVVLQEGKLVGLGLALDQREGEIAAEDRLALLRQPVGQARRERADAGDRHHAERDAGDEDVEAGEPAAQFAQGKA